MSDIFWINGRAGWHLAIVLRPHGDKLLDQEMRRIREGGIDTLVSLLEPFEAEMLGLGAEADAAARAGIEFLSHPIADTHVPADLASFRAFINSLAARLEAGEKIGVHCRGCIGRATITAACTLIHLGWQPRAALDAIALARGVWVPDTVAQEAWILSYKALP